jgi:3-oxoacyl-[acyl-carrier-protein] synthase II
MLCGGADELSAIVCGSFDMLNATSFRYNDEPSKTPRPFDVDRDGTVCGEGAGCIVLESEEMALKRGARILAEVIGFSTSSSGTHLSHSESDSIESCMKAAIESAGLSVDDIDYVNAHATGTVIGDIAEAGAIRSLFGERSLPVSSFKGHMGHTLGASGALELAASILMINKGKLIPNLNFTAPGEGCEGLDYIDGLRQIDTKIFMKNSFAFGGINSVLILKMC